MWLRAQVWVSLIVLVLTAYTYTSALAVPATPSPLSSPLRGEANGALSSPLGGEAKGALPSPLGGEGKGEEAEIPGKDGAPMVLVPAGPFPMGVPPGARDGGRDEYPRHEVFLDAYYIDTFEVTNGRYLEFMTNTGHRPPKHPNDPRQDLWQAGLMPESIADRPVINVDWYDAEAYCRWAGKRLPTEAEWAKAARGTDDRRFPWGNVEPTHGHVNFNQPWQGEKTLMPVGTYEAGKSPFGAYDMAGNVWEWVADWYDPRYYEKSPARNPKGPETGTHKALRGSGWEVEAPLVRAFSRVKSDPLNRNYATGFRCARSLGEGKGQR